MIVLKSQTAAGSMSVADKARQELEGKINEHNQIIVQMKRQINNLVLVSQLPTELLVEVFMYYAAAQQELFDGRSHYSQTYDWLRISHVCHHWREVALACPWLWTTIAAIGLAGVQEMLARSKSAPIEIRVGSYASLDALNLALREWKRLRRLDIRHSSLDMSGVSFPRCTPMLRTITLGDRDQRNSLYLAGELIKKMEICDMPVLEQLEITNYDVKWQSPLLRRPTLTHFVYRSAYPALPVSLANILSVLDALPLLEYLELGWVLPHPEDLAQTPPDDQHVDLPSLSRLYIADTSCACMTLLGRLTYPPTTRIKLDCQTIRGTDVHAVYPAILAWARTLEGAGPEHTIKSVSLHTDAKSAIIFQLWPTVVDTEQMVEVFRTVDWRRCIDVRILPGPSDLVIKDFVTDFPWTPVESLHINPTALRKAKCSDWVNLFKPMVNLRHLSIGSWGERLAPSLIDGRMPCGPRQGTRRRLQPILPRLESLSLEDMQLQAKPARMKVGLSEKYHRALEKRAKLMRANLPRLCIRRCDVMESDINGFKSFVDEVVWEKREVNTGPNHFNMLPASRFGTAFGYALEEDEDEDMDMDMDFDYPHHWAYFGPFF